MSYALAHIFHLHIIWSTCMSYALIARILHRFEVGDILPVCGQTRSQAWQSSRAWLYFVILQGIPKNCLWNLEGKVGKLDIFGPLGPFGPIWAIISHFGPKL